MSNHPRYPVATRRARAGLWLALALLSAAAPPPAPAAPAPRAHVVRPTSTTTDGWNMGRVIAHFRTRSGVIQLCFLALATGLYILMRKLDDGHGGG
jgi:hypothetical protein